MYKEILVAINGWLLLGSVAKAFVGISARLALLVPQKATVAWFAKVWLVYV